MDIQIMNLADRMEFVDTVSRWLWKEWASDKAFEYIKYATLHNLQRDRIPMTFVAIAGDRPVGTVSIWMNDLKCRQDLYPWMASLYVVEEERSKGIGAKLQAHAIEMVNQLGYSDLYLFTDHDGYYEQFGWTFLEQAPMMNGEQTKIYSRRTK